MTTFDLAFELLMVIACLLLISAFVVIRLLQARGDASQRDFANRKRLEKQLEESQALFSGALDASNVDIAILNAEGRILFVNEAWSTLANDNKNQGNHFQVGCNYFAIVNTNDPAQRDVALTMVAGIKTVLDGNCGHFEFEYPVQGSLETRWFLLNVNRFRSPGPLRVVISHENITVRKEAQERLLNKQEKLRSIYHASSDGILLVNEHGIFDANEKSAKLLGVDRVEYLCGRQVWELAVENLPDGQSSKSVIEGLVARVLDVGETRCELIFKHRDGTEFPAELMLSTFLHYDEQLVLVTFRDISDRKQVERRLQQMNHQLQEDLAARTEAERQIRETTAYLDVYRKIVDHHAIVAETDTAGTIVSVNDAFCTISGYSREELVGLNHRILNSGLHAREMWRDMYRTVVRGGFWHGEICNRAKNGRLYWVDTTIAPLFQEGGKLRGYFAIRADITSLKTVQAQAEAASRSKSEFLANMSHEIRTPMTAILGYTDLLTELGTCEKCKLSSQAGLAIETIKRNGEHLLAIINDILDISKIEADKMTVEAMPTEVAKLVNEVLTTMQVRSQAKGLTLTCELETAVPKTIITDPTRLRQILVNLIGNAIKFTEHGRVMLKLSCKPTRPELLFFSVLDSGIGMTPEHQERLFQAFEQADTSMTRRFGGTGLGLRISKRLAMMLGGDIAVESQLGQGACFKLSIATGSTTTGNAENEQIHSLLPLTTGEAGRHKIETNGLSPTNTPATAGTNSLPLAGLRILLVEDGPDNQRLITHHLKKAGAIVQLVGNGKLAVEAMTCEGHIENPLQSPVPFDLILMDMQMPIMDGREATKLLRRKGATLPILALTAHAMQADLHMCLDAGCDLRITKPIDRQILIDACRSQARHSPALPGLDSTQAPMATLIQPMA